MSAGVSTVKGLGLGALTRDPGFQSSSVNTKIGFHGLPEGTGDLSWQREYGEQAHCAICWGKGSGAWRVRGT